MWFGNCVILVFNYLVESEIKIFAIIFILCVLEAKALVRHAFALARLNFRCSHNNAENAKTPVC